MKKTTQKRAQVNCQIVFNSVTSYDLFSLVGATLAPARGNFFLEITHSLRSHSILAFTLAHNVQTYTY